MVVLQYAASVLNPAPSNPTLCFSGGIFNPTLTTCSDMSWQIYMKHNPFEIVQPFLMLVPPAFAYVNNVTGTGGSGAATKQFFIPLAGDQNLSVIQISRIRALPGNTGSVSPAPNFAATCGANNPANSPLCMGMIFYSITFFRI
jgi:hypothetical protein